MTDKTPKTGFYGIGRKTIIVTMDGMGDPLHKLPKKKDIKFLRVCPTFEASIQKWFNMYLFQNTKNFEYLYTSNEEKSNALRDALRKAKAEAKAKAKAKAKAEAEAENERLAKIEAEIDDEYIFNVVPYIDNIGFSMGGHRYYPECEDKTIYKFIRKDNNGRYMFQNINRSIAMHPNERLFYTTSERASDRLIRAIDKANKDNDN
jgi:hypothetical protein